MGVDPIGPGKAYRTDKDLRSLFGTFPRADDGSKAELPNLIGDTIVPVVNLGDPVQLLINSLALERIEVVGNSPASQTVVLFVPVTERWLVWRIVVTHTDPVSKFINATLQQPGIGSLPLALGDSISIPVGGNWAHRNVPLIAQPAAQFVGKATLPLTAGQIFCGVLITRFGLTDTIPQTVLGF